MPFHDPHDASTNATAPAAPVRRAIRLHLRVAIPAFCSLPTRLITHLPQPVALVPAVRPEPVRAPARRAGRGRGAGARRAPAARAPAGRGGGGGGGGGAAPRRAGGGDGGFFSL